MQEKNPSNPAKQQEPGQQPSRQPGSTPEPRKDFPGKAPDVYGDTGRQGQNNPGRASSPDQGDQRRDQSGKSGNPGAGKVGNPGYGSDQNRREQAGSGQKQPGAGRNPVDR